MSILHGVIYVHHVFMYSDVHCEDQIATSTRLHGEYFYQKYDNSYLNSFPYSMRLTNASSSGGIYLSSTLSKVSTSSAAMLFLYRGEVKGYRSRLCCHAGGLPVYCTWPTSALLSRSRTSLLCQIGSMSSTVPDVGNCCSCNSYHDGTVANERSSGWL